MEQVIKQRYTHCHQNKCIQTCPSGTSHYEDPAAGCVRLASGAYDAERHFTVHATGPQAATLVAIDKCLIGRGPNKPKRCDCAFYTPGKIAFVEFKLRPPERERDEDTRQEKRLEEAAEQLIASITFFEQEGFITTHEVEAYAHVGFQPIIPAPTTTLTNLEALINEATQSFVTFFASNEVTL